MKISSSSPKFSSQKQKEKEKMASSLSLSFLIPLFFLILLVHQSLADSDQTQNATTPLITTTCSKTKYPDLCVSTLESDPRSGAATNTTRLSQIAMELSAAKANETFMYVYGLVNNATDYLMWAKLVACMDGYNSSRYRVGDEGLRLFEERKYEGAYRSVGYANKAANECNNMGVGGVLDERNKMMFGFTMDTMMILRSLF